MIPRYSVTQARNRFTQIVRSLESQPRVEVTRRGQTVAVMISVEAHEQMQTVQADFWASYQAFRATHDLDSLDLGPELFADARDRFPGQATAQHNAPTEIHP